MGLDMFLVKKQKETEVRDDLHGYIPVEIGYWRKVNAVHNWFVHNVQDSCLF